MKYHYALSSAVIGVSIVLVQPQVVNALSSEQVGEIAQGITVLIEDTDKKDNGSGIIIKKEGNTYTVLTAAHVVAKAKQYEIVTTDNQRHQLDYSKVKKLPNQIDLAVVTFSSNQNYQVAKVGNPDKAKLGTTVYVAGFPKQTAARKFSSINFPPPGQITANATQAVDGGYTLVYSIPTLPGMSGGPLLNQQGELIGIHGRGEAATIDDVTYDELNPQVAVVKSNNNLAISIYTFLRQAKVVNVDLGISAPSLQVAQALTAEDYFLKGADKYNKKDYQGAIQDFTEAIEINPKLAQAYYNRGNTRYKLKDYQGAIQDYNQAIKINPKDAQAYYNRGAVRSELKDYQGAIQDYNQAIEINPKYALAYNNRGIDRRNLKDYQGAIQDYTQAIKINPKYAEAYYNRGIARGILKDYQGAIQDYDQAIKINPKYAEAYYNRGIARGILKDYQGAIQDYDQAIKINPKDAEAYINRGIDRRNLKDDQGAIQDYTQAIKINPKYAEAYYNRGIARGILKDYQGAIQDYTQAIKINPKYAEAYYNRGIARGILKDYQGAIQDYDQAIKINPKDAEAYINRGIARGNLKDYQGAINDLNIAANLFQKQGDTGNYQKTLNLIKEAQRLQKGS